MQKNLHILNELKSISEAVANLPTHTPYQVSSQYFEELQRCVMTEIRIAELKPLTTFTVDANYFSMLPALVINQIKAEQNAQLEIETLSPLLASIRKKPTYTVDNQYFDKLSKQHLPKNQPAKLVRFGQKKWLQVAVAAAILGFIAISVFWQKDTPTTTAKASIETQVEKLSDDEISTYLEQTSYMATGENFLKSKKYDTDIQGFIQLLSDEEIENYLNESSFEEVQTDI